MTKASLTAELMRQSERDPAMTEYQQSVQRKTLSPARFTWSPFLWLMFPIYASFFLFMLVAAMYFLPEKMLAGGEWNENSLPPSPRA